MNKEFFKKLKIGFTGSYDWKQLKELLIKKLKNAETEEEFSDVISKLVASMFSNVEELDKTRKDLRYNY